MFNVINFDSIHFYSLGIYLCFHSIFLVRFILNDDLITHLFNRFGLSWEIGLKLWSNQIITFVLYLLSSQVNYKVDGIQTILKENLELEK